MTMPGPVVLTCDLIADHKGSTQLVLGHRIEPKMTLDIRGSLKNTKLSSNRYVVFEELISNAIDSYLIRKHDDPSAPSLRIGVEVEFSAANLLEDQEAMAISCTDNGC